MQVCQTNQEVCQVEIRKRGGRVRQVKNFHINIDLCCEISSEIFRNNKSKPKKHFVIWECSNIVYINLFINYFKRKYVQVNIGCKQGHACLSNMAQNFQGDWKDSQCRPGAKKLGVPSVCRQCCDGGASCGVNFALKNTR